MGLKIKSGETILFIGDSITDCGRLYGEQTLGNGYVKMFTDLAMTREPGKKITVINKGISGDRVVGLRDRWTDHVLRHEPDWLSVKIGINDIHSFLCDPANGVKPAVFREAYDNILARTRQSLPACRILLIDPFYISLETSDASFRKRVLDIIPEYVGTVHEMSRKYRARLVQTHVVFQKLLKYHSPDMFCGEPVHPNPTGHLVIADAVYDALSK